MAIIASFGLDDLPLEVRNPTYSLGILCFDFSDDRALFPNNQMRHIHICILFRIAN